MQFGNGGSQLGFAPKDLRSAALQHMGAPPDTSFLQTGKNFFLGGPRPTFGQGVERASVLSLAANLALKGAGGWPVTLLAMGLPFLLSGASALHNKYSRGGSPY